MGIDIGRIGVWIGGAGFSLDTAGPLAAKAEKLGYGHAGLAFELHFEQF